MQISFLNQVFTIFWFGLEQERAEWRRTLIPVALAATFLVLFSFGLDGADVAVKRDLACAHTVMVILVAVQLSLMRAFDPDRADGLLEQWLIAPIDRGAWFLGKALHVLLMVLAMMVPIVLMSAVFHGDAAELLLRASFMPVLVLLAFGLTVLGVLLSALTMAAYGKDMLFPLLFYPLSIPLLLAAMACVQPIDGLNQWMLLLGAFDVIYAVLGFLLFGELIDL